MTERTRTQDRNRLDQPQEARVRFRRPAIFAEGAFGSASEGFARFMGTPTFLIWMTIFVVVWLAWNTFMPRRRPCSGGAFCAGTSGLAKVSLRPWEDEPPPRELG